jgi:protein-S-isoprenylcysteine O-methyltransferase Ste14
MLVLRSIFFALLLPGTVTVVGPYFIVHENHTATSGHWAFWQWLGLLPIGIGVGILVWCIVDFTTVGRGTLAPVDPPKRLVVRGLYRCVRNPMYVGVITTILGEALLSRSLPLLRYAFIVFVAVHCFVLLYEERALRRKFGESYEAYCRRVPRWWPRLPHEFREERE